MFFQCIDLTIGVRAEPIIELFGHDLSEHGIGGTLYRKTREVFDNNGNFVGIARKGLSEKQQWALFRKVILCKIKNQYPHFPDHDQRRLSISDMLETMNIDKTMKEAKRRNVQEIAMAMRPYKAE